MKKNQITPKGVKRCEQMLDFISRYKADNDGVPPTYREIGKALGIPSTSTVGFHLATLERMGKLKVIPGSPRGIRLK
jgi:repressor LexA